jgi:hypothetical protein
VFVKSLRASLIALSKEVQDSSKILPLELFSLSFPKIGKQRKNDPGNFPVQKPITRSVTQERNKVVSEPNMSDQRLERLESEMGSMKREMQALFQGLSAQLSAQLKEALSEKKSNEETSSSKTSKDKGVVGSSQGSMNSKLAKLVCPRYDGTEDPTSWVCRVEQYFEFQQTEEENKVLLTAYHLEGEAQLWYQIFKEDVENISWENLKEALHVRFGPTQFEDFYGDLSKLGQTGSVKEYQCQFERLLSRVGKLSQAHQVGCFVSGLKESIRTEVQAAKPTTLTAAVGLARLYEARVFSQEKATFLEPKPNFSQTQGATPPIRTLTESEMKDRRERGLCFNCDEKFRPGHRCKKLFLIEGIYPPEEDGRTLPRPRAVLEFRTKKGITEVLAHWEGLSPDDATWENLERISAAISIFCP